MGVGSFVFMLHSHLPFYRKAGMWPFGEESVYECMCESYIPLLNAISELWQEGIPAKLTIGITPVLAEQLGDPHINAGFEKYLNTRLEAAKKDEKRFSPRGEKPDPDYLHLARFYVNWFSQTLKYYIETWDRDLLAGFKKFQDLGAIEITTSAATHCFSPLLATDESINAQYKVGVESYKRHFGKAPKGFWLPECAYRPEENGRPGMEKFLYDNNLKYFFTESFAIRGGKTAEIRKDFGPYGTIEHIPMKAKPKTGHDIFEAHMLKEYPVAAFGRHEEAGFQVWSADHGYPGDGNYREFHKKDDVSGLHYWKLTSKKTDLADKQLYNPEAAAMRMKENSDHYVGFLQQCLTEHLKSTGEPGMVMVSFDTELFGHWWFEGVSWIKEVIRKIRTYTAIEMQTASEYLESHPPTTAIELPESSWGAGGHWQVWLNSDTEWMWPIIHQAEKSMLELASLPKSDDVLSERAFNQAGRELFLLESSDWPFLVTTGQAKDYAIERFNEHHERFNTLFDMLKANNIEESKLVEIESIDNCFPEVSRSSFALKSKTLV